VLALKEKRDQQREQQALQADSEQEESSKHYQMSKSRQNSKP